MFLNSLVRDLLSSVCGGGSEDEENTATQTTHLSPTSADDDSLSSTASTDDSNSTASEDEKTISAPGEARENRLEIIFNNPILLSSLLKNFKREDYTWLSHVAGALPGVPPWPIWKPATEPWPQGKLPFDI